MLSLLYWQRGFWNFSLTTPTCATTDKKVAIIHLLLKTECNLWPLKVKFSYVFKISNYFAWDDKDVNPIFIKFYTKSVSSVLKHNNFFSVSLLCYGVPLCAGFDWDSYVCLTMRSGEWIVLFVYIRLLLDLLNGLIPTHKFSQLYSSNTFPHPTEGKWVAVPDISLCLGLNHDIL